MKNFDRLNRRTHLYLGLFLLPWFIMYGASSFVVNHQSWFNSENRNPWELVSEQSLDHAVPEKTDQHELRKVSGEILREAGQEGAFWAQRPKPNELRIERFSFWGQNRLTYLIAEKKLRTEHQRIPGIQSLLRMHFRGGFEQPTIFDTLWAIVVDLVCVSIVAWIATGLIMWWRLRQLRGWGALALGGGIASFAVLLATL